MKTSPPAFEIQKIASNGRTFCIFTYKPKFLNLVPLTSIAGFKKKR